jgi:hypothetical protein
MVVSLRKSMGMQDGASGYLRSHIEIWPWSYIRYPLVFRTRREKRRAGGATEDFERVYRSDYGSQINYRSAGKRIQDDWKPMTLVRLWEKVTGQPHRHDASQHVVDAANDLAQSAKKLNAAIKPYLEADDPLIALVADLINQRAMREKNDKPELRT